MCIFGQFLLLFSKLLSLAHQNIVCSVKPLILTKEYRLPLRDNLCILYQQFPLQHELVYDITCRTSDATNSLKTNCC